ncbi:uncharacterized membrane protein YGR149W [Kluyveromyces marxianus]|uniref:Glycerophosphocholine acyltransferase 1 n=1 Tax=Kluyveromyces marxianus (strain DMKU3-1042 / BCC 29191 / NBRC 104275) TaxID=1003335 RepID=W0T530_KLUMD|nr:uncharacterized protein KLMA_20052 [Kluyveromyces marxianus DMKU3-1042]BAO38510.1 uncharacterized membrane protein YGR149W [Kluyveromyces marxianus DMKU3-1042]BAP70061.1 uncharacterized membrane protein YGR149W [Kluyveromyces marxianus]
MSEQQSFRIRLATFIEFLDPIASTVQSYSQPSRNYIKEKLHSGKSRLSLQEAELSPQLAKFKIKTLNKLKTIDKPLQSIFFQNSSTLEKSFYPFTLFNIFLIGFIIGRYPEHFHLYYTGMLCLLMPVRFYTYYKTNNHYFLADLCYFVNALCLLFIWALPGSTHLYQTCFAFTFGTLSFAIITWRNSLVIHSVDKITSCFIHIMPPLTMYCITHAISEPVKLRRFPAAASINSKDWNFKTNVFYTSMYYLVWQSLYHYFITVRNSQKIKSGQRMTSFEYLTTHQYKNSWAVKLPPPLPMVLYTLFQYCYQLVTMILCVIWFNHKGAASAFLTFIFLYAAKNGASYYIDYYGKKFEKEVYKLKIQVETLEKQLNEKGSTSSMSLDESDVASITSNQSDELTWEMKLPTKS